MNKILIFGLQCELELTKEDLWDEFGEENLHEYIEVINCESYDQIFEKLKSVNAYDYEVLYFEISKKEMKMKSVYTCIYRYAEMDGLEDISTQVVLYRGVGFYEGDRLSETEKELGDFVNEIQIYDSGTEEDAYESQMKKNTSAYSFFVYRNKEKATACNR